MRAPPSKVCKGRGDAFTLRGIAQPFLRGILQQINIFQIARPSPIRVPFVFHCCIFLSPYADTLYGEYAHPRLVEREGHFAFGLKSKVWKDIMSQGEALEDVRWEHHLRHRGRLNYHLAELLWCAIGTIVVTRVIQRLYGYWTRRRDSKGWTELEYAHSATRAVRWAAYLKVVSAVRLSWGSFSVSGGRALIVCAYVGTIASLLLSVDAPTLSEHFADDVAFRAAWITLTQIPLVYFLATKRGPLQLLTGMSYERINWLHRWVGRTLFISATAHMAIMMSSISIGDLVDSHEKGMTVVRYGMGAYGTLAWIVVSSILPLRRFSYRLFYLNHWLSTLVFLVVAAKHVPAYARLPIHASFVLVAVDKLLSGYKLIINNISIRTVKRKNFNLRQGSSQQVLAMGHSIKMTTPVIGSVTTHESTTIIRLTNLPFSWKAGQHIRLLLPKLGGLEPHPFTPATCADLSCTPPPPGKTSDVEFDGLLGRDYIPPANDMVLMIKAHSGLTKRLKDYHSEWLSTPCPNASKESSSLTAYIDGPYGNPPAWESYENLVLMATSTGVSFILSVLDYLEQLCFDGHKNLRTEHIRFIWSNRHIEPQLEVMVKELLLKHSTLLRESNVKLEVEFYTTCSSSRDSVTAQEMREFDPFAHLRQPRQQKYFASRRPLRIRNPDNPKEWMEEHEHEHEDEVHEVDLKQVEPRVSEMHSRSSCETYVSSTLIDDEEEDDGASLFSDLESTAEELDSSWWSRLPSLRFPRPQFHRKSADHKQSCSCAMLRIQERKERKQNLPYFITRSYGMRPDVGSILGVAVPQSYAAKTMVAVCSNRGIVEQASRSVAMMNMEFAKGRRETGVEIHTEGFA
ncbi:unnamed protein product [Periconia digitata]|uniref:FAD-binding FR-type domain-containing protein n=1 Tax=Periconia digitata TaxID=1303443 RepID=A0A9W4UW86_9PLEO|nr:unnamed protein product [Periconia digitata]